ncbi:MAG TPA: hypothetical protein VNV88_06155 [Candidatus Solibacter sp.]|jgi:hypothetical protein|nr:hypothetical protein [Candidatus Solibacter sp.]
MPNYFTRHALLLLLAVAVVAQLSSGCKSTTTKANNAQPSEQSSTTRADSGQTIEGCILRKETAFYIEPRTGEMTRLNAGSQDLNAHMGHNVRLTGTMNQPGANPPASDTSKPGADNAPEFLVTRVDMVEEACPADIQKRIDQDNKNKKSPK